MSLDGFRSTEVDALLVDVAGGRGWDLTAFLEKHHDAPGRLILQDLPHVLDGIQLDDRIEKQAFDLFRRQSVQGKFLSEGKGVCN